LKKVLRLVAVVAATVMVATTFVAPATAAKKVKAVDTHSDWKKLIDPLVRRWITSFPNESGQKRKVTFLVTLNQSGFIIDVKKEKSSNDETWDQTVERAIWASSSWPLTKTHKSQSPLRISFETPD